MSAALAITAQPATPRAANDNLTSASPKPFGQTKDNAPANDNRAGYTTRHCRGLLRVDLIHRIKSLGCAQPTSKHIKDSATGLNYMHPKGTSSLTFGSFRAQARYYDPLIGRFLSIVPLPGPSARIFYPPDRILVAPPATKPVDFVASGYKPSMFNRYAYVANDPINNIDPTGECTDCRERAIQIINGVKGGWKATRGYAAAFRYERSFVSHNPGPHNDRDFVNEVIGLGANFAYNNPKLAARIGLDAKLDKGIGYNVGKHGVGLAVTVPLAPEALVGKAALGVANMAISVSGGMLDTAYQALGSLKGAGISPNNLSNQVMGQIGAVIINEGTFSYNSKSNVLTGTWQYQGDNGQQLTSSVDIKLGGSRLNTCTGTRIC